MLSSRNANAPSSTVNDSKPACEETTITFAVEVLELPPLLDPPPLLEPPPGDVDAPLSSPPAAVVSPILPTAPGAVCDITVVPDVGVASPCNVVVE